MTLPPPISFDRVAEIYDATRGLPADAAAWAVDRLTEVAATGPILDVGTGTGRYSGPLVRRGVRVVGIDVGPRMLARAVARGLDRSALADARRMPFRDGVFGAALSTHVLHLIPDWRAAVAEIARVTQGTYASVLEKETAVPDLDAAYKAGIERHGCPTDAPGLPERQLPAQLPPDATAGFRAADRSVPADDLLRSLAGRAYRIQWTVPAAVHDEVMGHLRHEYSGATVRLGLELTLATWRTSRLSDFVRPRDGDAGAPPPL